MSSVEKVAQKGSSEPKSIIVATIGVGFLGVAG